MTPPVPEPIGNILVSAKEDITSAEDFGLSQHEFSQPKLSISREGEETVIVVTEKTRDWSKYLIAIIVLFCTSGGSVADQQLSKLVNSPTFDAPFFFLWYSGLLRSSTYAVYLPFRVLYEYIGESKRSEGNIGIRRKPISRIIQELIHNATLAFGPNGITLRSFSLNILPFSLSWIATNGLFYWAVTYASVSESVTIGSSFIVMTYIVSWIFLKESFLIFKSFGIIICLSGVGLTAYASGTTLGQTNDSLIGAVLTTGSAISLALTTVAFKRIYGSPNVNQVALYLSATSITNVLVSWPLFLGLRLSGNETWNFISNPWDLMSVSAIINSGSALMYYIGTSLISPVFISLSRPLQIIINYGIDLGTSAVKFNVLSAIGTGLVLIGFLILIIPNSVVTLELRKYTIRLRPGRKFVLTQTGCDNLGMTEIVEPDVSVPLSTNAFRVVESS